MQNIEAGFRSGVSASADLNWSYSSWISLWFAWFWTDGSEWTSLSPSSVVPQPAASSASRLATDLGLRSSFRHLFTVTRFRRRSVFPDKGSLKGQLRQRRDRLAQAQRLHGESGLSYWSLVVVQGAGLFRCAENNCDILWCNDVSLMCNFANRLLRCDEAEFCTHANGFRKENLSFFVFTTQDFQLIRAKKIIQQKQSVCLIEL